MRNQAAYSRRALFSTTPIREWIRPRVFEAVPEITVARRAMACEFSVVFPNWVRFAADAGYAALDEVERIEQQLSIYTNDSALSQINQSAADYPLRVDLHIFRLLEEAVRISHE